MVQVHLMSVKTSCASALSYGWGWQFTELLLLEGILGSRIKPCNFAPKDIRDVTLIWNKLSQRGRHTPSFLNTSKSMSEPIDDD